MAYFSKKRRFTSKKKSASPKGSKATFVKFDSHAAWEREKKTLPARIFRGFGDFCDTSKLKTRFCQKGARDDAHTYQLRGQKRCKTSILTLWGCSRGPVSAHTLNKLVRTPNAVACLGKKHVPVLQSQKRKPYFVSAYPCYPLKL